jgi:excisionase family DNA binding protein
MRRIGSTVGRPSGPRRPRFGVNRRGVAELAEAAGLAPLIDAKAAGRLLGVPHTWLLAQARAGTIPHHRLGHYVRFDAADLRRWLEESRRGPYSGRDGRGRD